MRTLTLVATLVALSGPALATAANNGSADGTIKLPVCGHPAGCYDR